MRLLVCCLVAVSAFGCEAFRLSKDPVELPSVPVEESPLERYLVDRLLDALDCFIANVSAGPGVIINARGTKLGQAGIGMAKINRLGFVGRRFGRWAENRTEIGVSLLYLSNSRLKPLVYNRFLYDWCVNCRADEVTDIDMLRNHDRDFFDVAVTVHILFAGFELGFRLREFADFLLGLFTVDFQGDDKINRARRKAKVGATPSAGRTRYVPEALGEQERVAKPFALEANR